MRLYIFLFICLLPALLFAQSNQKLFSYIELKTDSQTYNTNEHIFEDEEGKQLWFTFHDDSQVTEIRLVPADPENDARIYLIPSADYEVIDSMVFYDQAWMCKIRFKNLTQSMFLKLQFAYRSANGNGLEIVRLFPCTYTVVDFKPASNELFIGEEKTHILNSSNNKNLRLPAGWMSYNGLDYRIENVNDQLIIHIIPNKPGLQKLSIPLQTVKPAFDRITGKPVYALPSLEYTFNVKSGRLKYLNVDRMDITMDEKSRTRGIEIQIDNSANLDINKTYRIENQEDPGGVLIAEIFTRSYLSDNRVLCYLKTYNYHQSSQGYLYIKDNDQARFISNFNITPATSISGISIMRDGGDWIKDLSVYPGETIGVKIEGIALHKAKFHFEDLLDVTTDTTIRSEQEVVFKLKIPLDISKKRLNLYNYSAATGLSLSVKEFENPRPFDYIMVNYGDINRVVSGIQGPILFEKTIRDIIITFNANKIDTRDKLYGRQHLTIDIKVTGPANELIDMKTLPNVTVCPADNSPRFSYYEKKNCSQTEISLNKYLRRSTSDLEDWSRIHLTFKNTEGRYGEEAYQKELEIILKKKTKFDIDVSFPAGLVTVSKDDETNKTSYSNLYGISMAMVAQFAFYHPEKIAKLRPYRFGAGFLALDAFNFQSEKQDLALVALASLYPTTRDKKLAFPLYIGGGYQFKANKWLLLIGPGISVKL